MHHHVHDDERKKNNETKKKANSSKVSIDRSALGLKSPCPGSKVLPCCVLLWLLSLALLSTPGPFLLEDSTHAHLLYIKKMLKKIKLTFVKKPKVSAPAVGSSLLGPSSSGKPKKRKIKIIQKAKERTQEEIERDENWKASLVDTLHKLKPSFSDLENQLPEPIPLGTVGEYLSDDVNNGYAGIWYGVKIVRMKEGLHHDTGKPKREYLVQYLGDWEEEDVEGETLEEWVDSHLVRPKPPRSVGTVISEFFRGDQVDVMVDPENAEGEWHSGTVLRNIGDEGYDVQLDRGGGTQVHHVLASNYIRPQLMWLGMREKSLLKRSANMWVFKEIPRLQMPPDEVKLDKTKSDWDRLDKDDEKDEDFEGNEEDGNSDDDADDIEDDGWGSNGGKWIFNFAFSFFSSQELTNNRFLM